MEYQERALFRISEEQCCGISWGGRCCGMSVGERCCGI